MTTYNHDPNAKLDYGVDWSPWLSDGETIDTSTWTVPTGITQTTPSASHTDTQTTIWLTGGTVMTTYAVINHITTNQGREDDRTLYIFVKER